MLTSSLFYAELPAIDSFLRALDFSRFVAVPDDWYIVVTDIVHSTRAIEAGRYKEVNLLGACSIAAILNVSGSLEIPYVFGGDGASILIPPVLWTGVHAALIAVQRLAHEEFGLDLRVGIVPIPAVRADGYEVKVAKFRMSHNYTQALFVGGGLEYATQLVKNPATAHRYICQDLRSTDADLSGLECRWQDIPSRHGEMMTLLLCASDRTLTRSSVVYRNVLEKIQQIYGDEPNWHPIMGDYLNLTFNFRKLLLETRVRSGSRHWLGKLSYLLKIELENVLGLVLMAFGVQVGEMNWGAYRRLVEEATDYRKFDDMLRMVISGTPEQRKQLTAYLDQQYQEGQLVYGLHVSDRALMTCLVFERHGRQVHFVDGADGGYALAAKQLKRLGTYSPSRA